MIAYNTASIFAYLLNLALQFRERLILQLERRTQSAPDPIHNGIGNLDSLIAILKEGAVIEEGILTDSRLSDTGRHEKLFNFYGPYRKRLGLLGDPAQHLRTSAARLERELLAPPTAKLDPMPDFLQIQEVQRYLRSKPVVGDRVKLLIDSLSAGQQHILRAVLLDPFQFSKDDRLIPAHDLERVQAEYAKKPDDGKRWNVMETQNFVAEVLEQMDAAVTMKLSSYDTIPGFDPKTTTRKSEMPFFDSQADPAKNPSADKPADGQSQFQ